jgi:hypothetical protein
MGKLLAIWIVVIGWAGAASAIECPEWKRLAPEQKSAQIEKTIEAHLTSNVGRKFTSENTVNMRRCLYEFVEDIADQFDGECAQGRSAAKNALDQIFDKYFLSCVQ